MDSRVARRRPGSTLLAPRGGPGKGRLAGAGRGTGPARGGPPTGPPPRGPGGGRRGGEGGAAGPPNAQKKGGGSGGGDEAPPCTRKRSQGRRNHGLRPVCEL